MIDPDDDSLYGGNSEENVPESNKARVTGQSPLDSVNTALEKDYYYDDIFEVTIANGFCSSTPISKRCLSLTDFNSCLSGDEETIAIKDRRLEQTMPDLAHNEYGHDSEKRDRKEAARKIQQSIMVNAYRKMKQEAKELKEKLEILQKSHENTMLKLKASKTEADLERTRATNTRKDFVAILNKFENEKRNSAASKEAIEKLRDETAHLETQCRQLEEKVQMRELKLNEVQVEVVKQKEVIQKQEAKLIEKDAEAEVMQTRLTELEQKVKLLVQRVEEVESQNIYYAENAEKREQDLQEANGTIDHLNATNAELEEVVKTIENELIELKVGFQQQVVNEETLSHVINDLNQSVTEYSMTNDALQETLRTTRKENFELKKRIAEDHIAAMTAREKREKWLEKIRRTAFYTGYFIKAVTTPFMPYRTSFIIHDL